MFKRIGCISAFLLVSAAMAAQAGSYGYAGCGLGAIVFGHNQNRAVQTFAATTNATFYSQTFGITSGTSECTEGGVARKDKAREVFVAANIQDITREMAAGKGEFVTALGTLSGCGAQAMPQFLQAVQSHYEAIYPSAATQPLQFLESVDSVIASDTVLSGACGA
jgi:hypothetical protein